jgi:phage terminase small subunit
MDHLRNLKHEAFCLEYILDLNATQAYIRAGYSKKGARVGASNLLAKTNIQNRIQDLFTERSERTKCTADSILTRLVEIFDLDLAECFDSEGKLLTIPDMPRNIRKTIGGVDISRVISRTNEDKTVEEVTLKLKVLDRLKALELAGKHVGVRAFDNTVVLDVPPKVYRNFTGRKEARLKKEITDSG